MSIQRFFLCSLLGCFLACAPLYTTPGALAARIKDIATVSGTRANQLTGYGLVVGLQGAGDSRNSRVTVQTVANMLEQQGVKVNKRYLRSGNVAVVMVTAQLPVSAVPGNRMDIGVSAVGDSTSLSGGTLLMTPLKGADGNVYALAQGQLAVGGYSVSGGSASSGKNSATTAMAPGGAIVERNVPFAFNEQSAITLSLNDADFSTANQVVEAVNRTLGGGFAKAEDARTIKIAIPSGYSGNLTPLLASIENLDITPDMPARAVVNERTGTVVLGGNVRLSTVAVAHGNLQVVVREGEDVSQPAPFSQGRTTATPRTDLQVTEQYKKLALANGSSLQELVDGLNELGATPRDIISILLAVRDAGALRAQLVIQ